MSDRTRISTDLTTGRVTIVYMDERDERVERTFSTTRRDGHGYVIEFDRRGNSFQVCERLASTGVTLMSTRDDLPTVIRREYRAMRRAEARRNATFGVGSGL